MSSDTRVAFTAAHGTVGVFSGERNTHPHPGKSPGLGNGDLGRGTVCLRDYVKECLPCATWFLLKRDKISVAAAISPSLLCHNLNLRIAGELSIDLGQMCYPTHIYPNLAGPHTAHNDALPLGPRLQNSGFILVLATSLRAQS